MSSRTKINELTAKIYDLRAERTELSGYLDRARTDRDNNAMRANRLEAELAKYQPPKPALSEYEKLMRSAALYGSTTLYPSLSRYYDYKPAKPTYEELETKLSRANALVREVGRATSHGACISRGDYESLLRNHDDLAIRVSDLGSANNEFARTEVERRRKLAQAEAQVKELDNRLRKSIDDYNVLADRTAEQRREKAMTMALQAGYAPVQADEIERYLAGKPARKAKANGKSGK